MAIKKISIVGPPIQREFIADAAITPGHLVELTSTGVKVHATAGGNAVALFALEDELQGKEIGTAYTVSNRCQVGAFHTGQEVFAIIANGADIAVGDFLISAGDGTLKEVIVDSANVGDVITQAVVGVAMTACDMSGSAGVDPSPRCRVMIV